MSARESVDEELRQVNQQEIVQKMLAKLQGQLATKKVKIQRPTNKILNVDFDPYMYINTQDAQSKTTIPGHYQTHFIAISNNLQKFSDLLKVLYSDQQENEIMLKDIIIQLQELTSKFDSLDPEQIAQGLQGLLDEVVETKLADINSRLAEFEATLGRSTESLKEAESELRREKKEVAAIAGEVDEKLQAATRTTDSQ